MEDLYNRLKEAKEVPVLSYTLTPAEIYEVVELYEKVFKLYTYIEKMSYCEVVDNPRKDLVRILEKESDE